MWVPDGCCAKDENKSLLLQMSVIEQGVEIAKRYILAEY